MNGNTFLNVKYHLNKGIKIRNKQIQEKTKIIKRKEGQISIIAVIKTIR